MESFKKIGIKLYEKLHSQDTHCHNTFIESEVRKWQSSQSGIKLQAMQDAPPLQLYPASDKFLMWNQRKAAKYL